MEQCHFEVLIQKKKQNGVAKSREKYNNFGNGCSSTVSVSWWILHTWMKAHSGYVISFILLHGKSLDHINLTGNIRQGQRRISGGSRHPRVRHRSRQSSLRFANRQVVRCPALSRESSEISNFGSRAGSVFRATEVSRGLSRLSDQPSQRWGWGFG